MASIRRARLEDASGIAQVRVASWRSAYRNILPAEYLERMSVDSSRLFWESVLASNGRQGQAYVAVDERAGVVGFAIGGPERGVLPEYAGELYAIYLLQEWQGRGLGRGLFLEVAHWLHRSLRTAGDRRSEAAIEQPGNVADAQLQNSQGLHGSGSMIVWVLKENHPARAFYRALGGRPAGEKQIDVGGTLYPELAYGWRDLGELLGM